MKLPSLHQISQAALTTLRRFPFAIADAIVGSIAAFILVDSTGPFDETAQAINRIFIASTLGISLFTAIVLTGEKRRWSPASLFAAQGVATVLLVLYAISLPKDIYFPPFLFAIRHWLLLLVTHLFVAFAPFSGRGEVNGFWQFNKSLFLRVLTAVLFSGVLWVGLAIAIAAIDHLFGVNVRGERYLELWILIAGVFNTWFFLSGIPGNLDDLEKETGYPKGLKVFTQYVLLPLVVVYVLILYAYLIKIIAEWTWPKGWVANLVLGFSITGIFSLLLVHPIRQRAENVWIDRFARWYYIAEIPLVVVLLLAIWRRITEYGITENRYFVLVLGLWLAGIVLYFLIRKRASIKAIPASLCILALLTTFGPWGAFQVSERSQATRLLALLNGNGMIQDGKAVRAERGVPFEDAREISSILRYLHAVHGFGALQPLFREKLDTLGADVRIDRRSGFTDAGPRALASLLGVDYIQEWQERQSNTTRFEAEPQRTYQLTGFQILLRPVTLGRSDSVGRAYTTTAGTIRLSLRESALWVTVERTGAAPESIAMPLGEVGQRLLRTTRNPYGVPGDAMVSECSGTTFRIRLYMSVLAVEAKDENARVERVEGDLLLGFGTVGGASKER
jgi:hypothetical protein